MKNKMSQTLTSGQLLFMVIYLACYPTLLFGLAGDWRWLEGWIFCLILLAAIIITTLKLAERNPRLLQERFASPIQAKQPFADKVILLLFMISFISWYVVMPLDAVRFNWSPAFPVWLTITGGILFLIANILLYQVFMQNSFLFPVVKTEQEQNQYVVSSGFYALVRHPMYSILILSSLAGPLLLGSLWGLLMSLLITFVITIRTYIEEKTLIKELQGYEEYRRKVRYRLIPYIY